MGFVKGQSGNLKGRPIKDKKPTVKQRIEKLLERSLDDIEAEIETATPETKREFFINLTAAVYSKDLNPHALT